MPELLFYCELLSNIKQVSVSIEFVDENQDEEKQDENGGLIARNTATDPESVTLHPSKRVLNVVYSGTAGPLHVFLPTPVQIVLDRRPPRNVFRLPVLLNYLSSTAFGELNLDFPAPWDAEYLNAVDDITPALSSTRISINCASCNTVIVPERQVAEWRNLPSEHWADLMDLWHCHKPHDENQNGDGKGKYAGVGRISAIRGVGLVDPMYFLIMKDDCKGIREISSTDNQANIIVCSHCELPLGVADVKSDGLRLMKWALSISKSRLITEISTESYPKIKWITSNLLSLIESTGQYKFLVMAGSALLKDHTPSSQTSPTPKPEIGTKCIQIWIFNPKTLITTSRFRKPTKAIKVYYRDETVAREHPDINDVSLDLEIIYLPEKVYDEFKKCLDESNICLPRELRTWNQQWNTGWLERF